jgi:hypothetical protein
MVMCLGLPDAIVTLTYLIETAADILGTQNGIDRPIDRPKRLRAQPDFVEALLGFKVLFQSRLGTSTVSHEMAKIASTIPNPTLKCCRSRSLSGLEIVGFPGFASRFMSGLGLNWRTISRS